MSKSNAYKIEVWMVGEELDHLIASLEKSGGDYSKSLLTVIRYQKEVQDAKRANKEQEARS